MKVLPNSCDLGTTKVVNKIWIKVNIMEILRKKLISVILSTPLFQNTIISLFISYFAKTYEKLKNNEKGKILLIIFGKFKTA
tara:strand:- start:319 stop:564 length:246 start_codon:yes stop_codon:yes gene_type:complete